jgi:uncharacterized membrane protein (Fun14 family)
MNPLCTNSRGAATARVLARRGGARGGFALLITVTLLAFVVVLLLSLVTFTRVETVITVNTEQAAAAVPRIVDTLEQFGVRVPIIGDFHYNGHILLKKYPE